MGCHSWSKCIFPHKWLVWLANYIPISLVSSMIIVQKVPTIEKQWTGNNSSNGYSHNLQLNILLHYPIVNIRSCTHKFTLKSTTLILYFSLCCLILWQCRLAFHLLYLNTNNEQIFITLRTLFVLNSWKTYLKCPWRRRPL